MSALTFYTDDRQDLPVPSPLRADEVMISTTPTVAAKLALYTAMRAQGVTAEHLAEQLGLDEQATQKIAKSVVPESYHDRAPRPDGRWARTGC